MECIEKIGLIKVDLLGLRTLTYIEDTRKLVAERKGIEIDVNKIPLDEKKTFALLSKGDTLGVFQLEGGGMKELLIDIHPDRIDDIIACIALYRPGPMGSGLHTKYAKRKNLQEPIEYLHPLQEPALAPTYGVLTYQEQVGQLLQGIAGFDMSEAMIVMKAISKKRSRAEIQKYEDDFIAGAIANKVPENVAHVMFNHIEEFSGYGFNKAHSAAYGIVAYQTAYLKANYPLEFYCAFLSSEMHDSDKICQIIGEVQSKKIEVIPPDINASGVYFTLEGNNVRFALGAIKNVGVTAVDFIVAAREEGGTFKSLFDFTTRVDSSGVNKGVVESLILAGAMDSLPGTRSEKYATVDLAPKRPNRPVCGCKG
jgi:DNA polymerase-3 subunit alpha